jgi:signal transduction histidine kinase
MVTRGQDPRNHSELEPQAIVDAISHEFNTCLTTLIGNAHLLRTRGDYLDAAARLRGFTDLEGSALRLFKAVQNLLLLARIELGERPYLQPAVLPIYLEEVVAYEHEQLAPRKINFQSIGRFQPVAIDKSLIRIAIANLLNNADTFSPPDAPVELIAFGGSKSMSVLVSDNGPGVDESERQLIFEPFYRSPSLSPATPGLGIGLTVAQKLAQLHGGDIELFPRTTGGTTFSLTLPPLQMDSAAR